MGTESFKSVYADELRDLWSANDQMAKLVKVMAEKACDPRLQSALIKSVASIHKHAVSIKALLLDADEAADKEHCTGMEGLVREATKHITKEAPKSADLLDLVIIAQYQRMSHYGLAGFGTAAAYAKALGMEKHSVIIANIVAEIHKGEQYASTLAKHAERVAVSESK